MKPITMAVFTACLSLTACARMPTARPEDFSLTLEWDTGSLPPPYHYTYIISIGPDLISKFSFQPGYAPENSDKRWVTTFELQSKDLDSLFKTLAEKEILRSKWSTDQPLLGGQGTSLVITADGEKYTIPSVSILTRAESEKIEEVIKIIRDYVPKTIWNEMNARRAEFEARFEY